MKFSQMASDLLAHIVDQESNLIADPTADQGQAAILERITKQRAQLVKLQAVQTPSPEEVAILNSIAKQHAQESEYQKKHTDIISNINSIISMLLSIGRYPQRELSMQTIGSIDKLEECVEEIKYEYTLVYGDTIRLDRLLKSLGRHREKSPSNMPLESFTLFTIEQFKKTPLSPAPQTNTQPEVNPAPQTNTSNYLLHFAKTNRRELLAFLLFVSYSVYTKIESGRFPNPFSHQTRPPQSQPIDRKIYKPLRIEDLHYRPESLGDFASFLKTVIEKEVPYEAFGVKKVLEQIQPQLDEISNEKGVLAVAKFYFVDENSASTYQFGTDVSYDPITLNIKYNGQILESVPGSNIGDMYVVPVYVNGFVYAQRWVQTDMSVESTQ